MQINTDYYTPAQLTGYIRDALADLPANRSQLAQWLPNRNVPDLDYRLNRGTGGLTKAASYRTYDAESPIGSRPGLTRISGELPPISRKIRLGEYDRLRQRANAQVSVQTGLLSDADRLARELGARIELGRGDALVNGSVTLAENGVYEKIDFGRSVSCAIAAATPWTNTATADPLNDFLTGQASYVAINGNAPGATVMGTADVNLLLQNANLRTLGAPPGRTLSLLSRTGLTDIFQAYGLPPIYVIDEQFDVAGTPTRPIPTGKVLLLPEPGDDGSPDGTDLGGTFWGTTAESLEPEYALADGEEPGIVAGAYSTKDPVALWTKAAAIAVPVEANPNLTMTLTVR